MKEDSVLETKYLSQPRGPNTGWAIRMPTPKDLIGIVSPKTGKPYGKTIHEGLGTRNVADARKLRDIRLGEIRAEEAKVQAEKAGDVELALKNAEALRRVRHPVAKLAIREGIERYATEKIKPAAGFDKAKLWRDVARDEKIPLSLIHEKYLADEGKRLSRSSVNNLKTALKHFYAFAGEQISLQEVDRRFVGNFVMDYLPSLQTPQAPNGLGPASIRKKISLLSQLWKWSRKRGYLPYEAPNPWDEQGPSAGDVRTQAVKRRPFEPDETQRLLQAEPKGTALGDFIRLALSTGARLEEIAAMDVTAVEKDGFSFRVIGGKTVNAARYVPLVGVAQEVMQRRLKKHRGAGPLFSELSVRQSTGKRGAALSQKFTRLRRKVLGEETDGQLVEHSFRHTWRTAARRAGVDELTIKELGGWDKGDGAEHIYDHGLEKERYQEAQRKIVSWLVDQGYFGDEVVRPGEGQG